MRGVLRDWLEDTRDTGFLPESDYTRRAKTHGVSVREMAQSHARYDVTGVLSAAWGEETDSADEGVLFWQLLRGEENVITESSLRRLVNHRNASVAVVAAERACREDLGALGLPVLVEHIQSHDLRLALEAARALFNLGTLAKPVVAEMEAARKKLEGDGQRRRYRDFNYASFTGWALEGASVNCGAASWRDFDGF